MVGFIFMNIFAEVMEGYEMLVWPWLALAVILDIMLWRHN